MSVLLLILRAILEILVPLAWKEASEDPKIQTADRNPSRADRLADRVRAVKTEQSRTRSSG